MRHRGVFALLCLAVLAAVVPAVLAAMGRRPRPSRPPSRVTPAAAVDTSGQQWALIVGIDHYENLPQAPYAAADARYLRDALQDPARGQFAPDHVFLMTDGLEGQNRASTTKILNRLASLAQRIGPNDTFLLYFAGHGIEQGDQTYLLAADSRTDRLRQTALSRISLQTALEQIGARRIVIIIDACRTTYGVRMAEDAGARGSAGASRRTSVQAAGRAGGSDTVVGDSRSVGLATKKLARTLAAGSRATAVLLSCSPDEEAHEWEARRHGVFTYYLVQGLSRDSHRPDGALTLRDLHRSVCDGIADWSRTSGKEQTPVLETYGADDVTLVREFIPPGWMRIYSSRADSFAGWQTNYPDRFHWDETRRAYHYVSTDAADDYAFVKVPYHGTPFRLSFDLLAVKTEWAANSRVGLWDKQIQADRPSVYADFSVDDNGHHVYLHANWSGGSRDERPGDYSDGKWYHATIEYSPERREVTFTVTPLDDVLQVRRMEVTHIDGTFDLDRIGITSRGDRGYPGSRAEGYIRNVSLLALRSP